MPHLTYETETVPSKIFKLQKHLFSKFPYSASQIESNLLIFHCTFLWLFTNSFDCSLALTFTNHFTFAFTSQKIIMLFFAFCLSQISLGPDNRPWRQSGGRSETTRVGFVKQVSFKPGVKARESYVCAEWWIRRGRSARCRNRWVGNGGTGTGMRLTKRQRELIPATRRSITEGAIRYF